MTGTRYSIENYRVQNLSLGGLLRDHVACFPMFFSRNPEEAHLRAVQSRNQAAGLWKLDEVGCIIVLW